jgi:hypothetical protein
VVRAKEGDVVEGSKTQKGKSLQSKLPIESKKDEKKGGRRKE